MRADGLSIARPELPREVGGVNACFVCQIREPKRLAEPVLDHLADAAQPPRLPRARLRSQPCDEREELEEYTEEEAEELALIYNARGMELERSREASREIMVDPQQALQAMSREELGINPDDLGSPWGAAIASFVSFAVGALLPLLPFVLGSSGRRGLIIASGESAVALFAVGMAISLFTGRSAWRNGIRMVLIGTGAALVRAPLRPQAQTEPSWRRATDWYRLADSERTEDRPLTCTGMVAPVTRLPMPSWP